MDEREYTLEKISYSKKEDCRIIESVLNGWFQNPKTLNLVSPKLTYPFKFKDWVSKNYFESSKPVISIVIKSKNWIVGHISYRIERNKVHLFHLIIDEKFRGLGLAKLLIAKVERDCFLKQKDYITLNVLKSNEEAISLCKKLGYSIFKNKNSKTIVMKKNYKQG
tara:strand:+ start:372 stop:866 length:495 start_codon:yes stop_codon:yes gene_type:complete